MTAITPQLSESYLFGQLTGDITASATTITARFVDKRTGLAREPNANTKLFVMDKGNEKAEIILAGSHSTTGGVTTMTSCTRGISAANPNLTGGTGTSHTENAEIGCVDIHTITGITTQWQNGTNGSGANNLRVGDETDSNITFYAQNADGSKPFIRYSAVDNKWIFSNDGSSSTDVGGGTGSITGGDGITITAGDVDIDLTDTVIFVSSSSGAGDSGKVARLNGSGQIPSGFIPTGTDDTKIAKAFVDAKGDLITATAADTPAILTVGTNRKVLGANSGAATGLEWRDAVERKYGVATYDLATASGSTTIAHGSTNTPVIAKFRVLTGTSGTSLGTSDGVTNGTTHRAIYFWAAGGPGESGTDTSNAIKIGTTTGSFQTATAAFDGTNITLTWTKTGTPTGNAYILWETEA